MLLLPLATVALIAGTADAAPKPKPVTQKFEVTVPVPFPGTSETMVLPDCFAGQEGVSKVTTRVALPASGSLAVRVDFSGDWDLAVLDTKGKVLGSSESFQLGSTGPGVEKLVVKKAKKGPIDIAVCNWAGLPDGTVTWTLTPTK